MYKIHELIIHKSKRFGVTGISNIIYRPHSHQQLILGGNGSGKTSLIEELSPLPSDLTKTYNKGGGKKITIETDEGIFILQSGIELGRKHSLKQIVAGKEIELNESGLISIQTSLVKKIFGITPLIHHMCIGKKKFTSMTASERKNWLTDLDSVDYELIFNLFEKHKTKLRDLKGALKLAVSSNIDSSKLLDDEIRKSKLHDIEVLESKIEMIRKRISSYTKYSVPPNLNERLLKSIEKIEQLDDPQEILSMGEIKKLVRILEKEKSESLKTLSNLQNELKYSKLSSKLDTKDIKIITQNIKEIEDEIAYYDKINTYDIKTIDIASCIPYMERVVSPLTELIDRLDDMNSSLHAVKLVDIEVEIRNFNSIKVDLDKKMSNITTLKQHFLKHSHDDDVECPKCKTHFNPKIANMNIDEMNHSLKSIKEEISVITLRLNELNDQLAQYNNRAVVHNQIQNLLEQDKLKPFIYKMYENTEFNIITQSHILVPSIKLELESMHRFDGYNRLASQLSELKREKHNIEIEQETLSNIQGNFREQDIIQEDMDKSHIRIKQINMEIESLNLNASKIKDFKSAVKDHMNLKSKRFDMVSNLINQNEIETLNDITMDIEKSINRIRAELSQDDKLRHEVEFETKKIQQLQDEYNKEVEIVNGLSPNKGMIGESIGGFMSEFLGHVNSIISDMWEYKLEINPCKLSNNGALDYNFPVSIKGKETLKDIREGSLGMLEIFNLAFVVVSLEYLGLREYPIFLDEFGTSMDAKHRPNAFNLLKNISIGHSNIFMISHYMEFYGGFANLDVNVINTGHVNMDNITVYNKNMEITR